MHIPCMSPFYFHFYFGMAGQDSKRCKPGAIARIQGNTAQNTIQGTRAPRLARASDWKWQDLRIAPGAVRHWVRHMAHRPDTTTIVIAATSGLHYSGFAAQPSEGNGERATGNVGKNVAQVILQRRS
jgi:hypothetical protein